MVRFRVGRPITLSHEFLVDETETVLTPASVTVTVTALGASTPVATGAATLTVTVYSRSIGMLPEGVYTVRWDGTTAVDTEYIEVAGCPLFTVKEARQSDADFSPYTPVDIVHYREVVEDEFERVAGRSFIPVTRRFRVDWDGWGDTLTLPVRDVRSLVDFDPISVDVTGPDLADLDVDTDGVISGLCGSQAGAYIATVAYGFPSVPLDIKRVGMIRTRWYLAAERSGIPDRATSFQPVDGGTYAIATPGQRGSHTGLPEVDEALNGYTLEILNSFGGFM